LTAYPIGDPWLPAGLLKDNDPIYLVKWESEWERPKLLHIQSIEDVEIFGIDSNNYGTFVLGKEAWDARYGARYGLSVAALERAELDAAVPAGARVTRVPPTPTPPTSTGTPLPTPTPTATPTPSLTPTATPPLAPEEAARAALSQLLPWYDDPPYPLAALPFVEVWLRDPDLGRDLAQAPWVIDGITAPLEHNAPYGLGNLYDHDPALARRMLAYSTEEPVRTRNIHILNVLGDMARDDPASLELLQAQEWFADGLSPEERAFVIVLEKVAYHDTLYPDLLQERFTLQATVDLPLSGETVLWAFGHDAIEGNVLEAMEDGARAAERVMASPLPVTDLIMLQVNPERYGGGFGGVNRSDSMVLSTGSGWPDSAHAALLYHEVAHYYYLAHEIGPFWLVEGGADFVRAYRQAWDDAEDWDGRVPLFEGNEYAGRQWCLNNGVSNVAALAEAGPTFQNSCSYHLGHYLLTHLFNTIGEAAFTSAMAELYRSYTRFEFYPSEEEVYQVFRKHVPADRAAAFRDVYRRFHGGPFLAGS